MDEEQRLLVGVAIVTLAAALYWYRRKQLERAGAAGAMAPPEMAPPASPEPEPQHAVIVHVLLSTPGFGTEVDLDRVHALEDDIGDAVARAGVGEVDGHEIGQGGCELFLYGKNADEIIEVIDPIVRASPLGAGAWALKRYGPPSDPGAPTARVRFDGDPEQPS